MKYFRIVTTGRDEFVVVAANYRVVNLAKDVDRVENYYLFEAIGTNVICSIPEESVFSITEQIPYK